MGQLSPFSRDASPSNIVDKIIGNAYTVVRAVYDKLNELTYLAVNAPVILEAGNAALNVTDMPTTSDMGLVSDTFIYKTFDLGTL